MASAETGIAPNALLETGDRNPEMLEALLDYLQKQGRKAARDALQARLRRGGS